MDNHIVYTASVAGQIFYVGSGLEGRQGHIISGTSSCYEANKAHFEGLDVEVEVVKEGLTKEAALHYESFLYETLKPSWNKYAPLVVSENRGIGKRRVRNPEFKALVITHHNKGLTGVALYRAAVESYSGDLELPPKSTVYVWESNLKKGLDI